ncbi:MAG: HNH endonuclease signature motif containing protein [Rudaea sp.]|nr:HNH endonuclease signature motif containing protein [Rudaea sp.]
MLPESLRPKTTSTVRDLVRAAGVDVSQWGRADNPKYCYEWAFLQPGKVLVLNLWYDELEARDGSITESRNLRFIESTFTGARKSARRRRMQSMESAIESAAENELPVRVILCDGKRRDTSDANSKASKVVKRMLDPARWKIERYDRSSGDYTVVRDADPANFANDAPSADSSHRKVQFIEGAIYSRREDIHRHFGGSQQGGISVPANFPAIFIFTGDEGERYGYEDSWDDQGATYRYTGEGQVGDMQLARGNLAISRHIRDGRSLHLFKKVSRAGGRYRYIGEMQCAGTLSAVGTDGKGNKRQLIQFDLVKLRAILNAEEGEDLVASHQDTDIASLRRRAYLDVDPPALGKSAIRVLYQRSRDVVRYALARANGTCECCGVVAPFVRLDETPYLEVHHVDRVSDGGLDRPNRVAAICPTCHRRIHFGRDGNELNEKLSEKIRALEA